MNTERLRDLHGELVEQLMAEVDEDDRREDELREAWRDATEADRTAQSFPEWLEEYAAQIAAAWVVTAVFVRFLEDNDLIEEDYIAGPTSEARDRADETLRWFRREHSTASETDYLQWVFDELAELEAGGVFREDRNPLYRWRLPADAGRQLLEALRETDPDTGDVELNFEADPRNTRFLGDLYEALAENAGLDDKYGLVQTPKFVSEFILEYTLDPAIDELGAAEVRMLDPAAGSGHFLLDGFWRILEALERQLPDWSHARRVREALDSVHGVDLQSFAVAIARFRLLAAALQALGANGRPIRLGDAPELPLNVGAGDSLIHGDFHPRFETDCTDAQTQKPLDAYRWDDRSSPEDADLVMGDPDDPENGEGILTRRYQVVVGNPPYVTVSDNAQDDAYGKFYESCYYSYSLVCPFFERFFDLATGPLFGEESDLDKESLIGQTEGADRCPGWVGMIVGNNFMKRRFGQKLIEEIVPNCDLTHVVDTSEAYIPAHGTPTVTILGRNRKPSTENLRAIQSIRGPNQTPPSPDEDPVWQSITNHFEDDFFENEYITVEDIAREALHKHPWVLKGGGTANAISRLEKNSNEKLKSLGTSGISGMSNSKFVFEQDRNVYARKGIEPQYIRDEIIGECVRNWMIKPSGGALFPYDDTFQLVRPTGNMQVFLWRFREHLWKRAASGRTTYKAKGFPWYRWHRVVESRYKHPKKVVFAFTSTHNHFSISSGSEIFKHSAPVIILDGKPDEDKYCELLGVLNSSTAEFWFTQMYQARGLMIDHISAASS